LKDILERLGNWPVIVGERWKPPPYPLEVLLGRLRGEYNEGVLLEQWVGPDDKNSSANILQVRQQSKAPSVDDYTTRYFILFCQCLGIKV
jgi:membrane metallo-endopeptidase-like protein 1